MGRYLNSRTPLEAYREISRTRFFVDKTALLDDLLDAAEMDGQKYLCITRPRRFGKSVMASMTAAFFEKDAESDEIFSGLQIASSKRYGTHRNRYHVIWLDFSEIPEKCSSYDGYISRILEGLKQDLADRFPECAGRSEAAVWDLLSDIFQKTGEKFIFVMDEWDAIFHMPFITENDQKAYLLFLKALLKDKAYVKLAYMTGVLPIAKYSSGSELNMFVEYDMTVMERFSDCFGFTEGETDRLFGIYMETTKQPRISREELQLWYDGYHTASGERMYNPRSVVCALSNNQLASYWTSSGPYDEIFYYVKNNIDEIRDDLVLLISGEGVETEIRNYAAVSMELDSRDEIYSAMVIYGLLTYGDGKVFIPNRELMDKFRELVMNKESMGYVYRLANESKRMLEATLDGDTDTMAEILKHVHDTESPIFAYNNEIELSAVVNLVYLAARDRYRVEREDKAGTGYVDFIFYPEKKNADAIILELKVDSTPEAAIRQIRDRNYALRFKGRLGEKPKYTGRILAVGISYDRKSKHHFCRIEEL